MKHITKKDLIIPRRKKKAKKGDAGKLLIVGGSRDYVGALVLAGHAALRAGCDWVTVAAPEKVAWAINCLSADLVTKKVKGTYFSPKHAREIISLSKNHDCVLLGNGIGVKRGTKKFVKAIVKKVKKPLVIDADALKALSFHGLDNTVLTPHHGELTSLLENSLKNRKIIDSIVDERNIKKKSQLIQKNVSLKNNILLLKGPVDSIISKERIVFNKTGNPGMAKAGTGDVLAGLVAGFVAQGLSLEQAAVNATYINGMVGDLLLKKKKGYSFIASDLVEEIKHFSA